jgi:hypothetical protein
MRQWLPCPGGPGGEGHFDLFVKGLDLFVKGLLCPSFATSIALIWPPEPGT